MARWTIALCAGCLSAALAGCVSKSDFEALQKKVAQDEATLAADQAKFAALSKQLDKQFADLDARMKAGEQQAAATAAQVKSVSAEHETTKADLKKVGSTVLKVHDLLLRNMETMRDFYKRQYDAMSEILDKEKTAPVTGAMPAK